MSLDYRTVPLPDPWPGKATPTYQRRRSPFGENWGGTMQLLEREVRKLNGKDITLAIGVGIFDIRQDGGVKANARVRDSAVVLSFRSGANLLTFPCDTYDYWQHNVRAIALALEALRAVDRYGVQQGKQYEGFKALPASTNPTMSTERAAQVIQQFSGANPLASSIAAKQAVRTARAKTHPDIAPDRAHWDQVQLAADRLGAHFGVQL